MTKLHEFTIAYSQAATRLRECERFERITSFLYGNNSQWHLDDQKALIDARVVVRATWNASICSRDTAHKAWVEANEVFDKAVAARNIARVAVESIADKDSEMTKLDKLKDELKDAEKDVKNHKPLVIRRKKEVDELASKTSIFASHLADANRLLGFGQSNLEKAKSRVCDIEAQIAKEEAALELNVKFFHKIQQSGKVQHIDKYVLEDNLVCIYDADLNKIALTINDVCVRMRKKYCKIHTLSNWSPAFLVAGLPNIGTLYIYDPQKHIFMNPEECVEYLNA